MTILPHDRHLSIWQRAIARLHARIHAFRDWCRDDNVRLPDCWKPKQIERTGRGSDG
jgi:hypothetical protein